MTDTPHAPEAIDEPPVRAIASVTHYVNRVAEEAAREAIREHVARYHANEQVPVVTLEELLARLDGHGS